AMEQRVAEPRLGFERVAERMAEIQELALAGLALIDRDDGRLGGAAFEHRIVPQIGIALDELRHSGLQPIEESAVADEAVFHHLGIAGEKLAPRQGCQRVDIGDDAHRLVEGADEILPMRAVDRGLAADRAVDLREESCWHLHIVDAAQQGCGGKARQIANDAAAERDERRSALDAERQDVFDQLGEMREAFGDFARRQDDRLMRDASRIEPGAERRQMELGDILIADDDGALLADDRRDQPAGAREEPRSDQDIVAARAELDAQARGRAHGEAPAPAVAPRNSSSAAITLASVASGGPSADSTVMSASA